jgi:hypothetical protein
VPAAIERAMSSVEMTPTGRRTVVRDGEVRDALLGHQLRGDRAAWSSRRRRAVSRAAVPHGPRVHVVSSAATRSRSDTTPQSCIYPRRPPPGARTRTPSDVENVDIMRATGGAASGRAADHAGLIVETSAVSNGTGRACRDG